MTGSSPKVEARAPNMNGLFNNLPEEVSEEVIIVGRSGNTP